MGWKKKKVSYYCQKSIKNKSQDSDEADIDRPPKFWEDLITAVKHKHAQTQMYMLVYSLLHILRISGRLLTHTWHRLSSKLMTATNPKLIFYRLANSLTQGG